MAVFLLSFPVWYKHDLFQLPYNYLIDWHYVFHSIYCIFFYSHVFILGQQWVVVQSHQIQQFLTHINSVQLIFTGFYHSDDGY